MKITITQLCQDISYFIYYYHINIIKLILITTLIHIGTDYLLFPKKEEFIFINNLNNTNLQNTIENLSNNQKKTLLKISIAYNVSKLLSNTFLCSSILTMLHLISTTKKNKFINIRHVIKLSILSFPKLLLFIFCATLLIQLGLMLAIIPGIILAIIISLTPIIIITNTNISIVQATWISIKTSIYNINAITPAILLGFFTKAVSMLLFTQYTDIYKFIIRICIEGLNNMLFVVILIYLYRLHMIIRTI